MSNWSLQNFASSSTSVVDSDEVNVQKGYWIQNVGFI